MATTVLYMQKVLGRNAVDHMNKISCPVKQSGWDFSTLKMIFSHFIVLGFEVNLLLKTRFVKRTIKMGKDFTSTLKLYCMSSYWDFRFPAV